MPVLFLSESFYESFACVCAAYILRDFSWEFKPKHSNS